MAGKGAAKVATVDDAPVATRASEYELPVVHVHLPQRLVNVGFWAGLGGAVLFGLVDPPLGVLVGAGVIVARHRSSQ